jgi:hypothetical protein
MALLMRNRVLAGWTALCGFGAVAMQAIFG